MLSWRTRWKIIEYVRNSIWIVPAIFSALAIAMGLILPGVDERTDAVIGVSFGASSAQGILGALAGGMITFTGFVFSILLLAVQFGSSQFSPRMLRRFLRDPTTKIALGMFMATFIYALLVLRAIQPSTNQNFIPDISVTVALWLLLFSMILFLRLISRTTQGLRVAAVLGDLGRDGANVIDRIYPEKVGDHDARNDPQPASSAVRPIDYDHEPGVLQSVDAKGIVEIARKSDTVIELLPPIGDLIAPGLPLFRVHGDADAVSAQQLRESVAVGDERTIKQDPAFIFRLLADISAKALSPGVNDPTTSVQALDQIELLLRQLSQRRLTPGEVRDGDGQVRLRFQVPTWEDFVSIALDETRIFGEGSVQVSRRLRALLEDLLTAVPPHRRPAVQEQLAVLEASVGRTFGAGAEQQIAGGRDRQGIGSPRQRRSA
jgi:uncharacterized membrane protein